MLFHDRVSVEGEAEIIDYDPYGLPIYGPATSQVIPAHVDATTTSEGSQDQANQVISRYRVLLRLPAGLDADDIREVTWKGKTLTVDGTVQPQMLRGRINHHEFVTERVTG